MDKILPPTRLLLIADNAKDILMLRMMSADIKGSNFDLLVVKNVQAALDVLKKKPVALALLDLTAKGNKGLDGLMVLEENFPQLPVVILTGKEDQTTAFEAVMRGAQDYLVKGKLDAHVLSRVIHYAIERMRAMQEMREKNKELERLNALKSEFVSTVSHELRTPLTVVMSASNNLLDGAFGKLTDDQSAWVKKINHHALRLHEMINDILNLSKLQSGKSPLRWEWVDVAALVQSAIEGVTMLAEQKKQMLSQHLPEGVVPVWGDRSRLEQVLTNLLTNAIKYTPVSGWIELRVHMREQTIRFSVSDTGPGIPEEHRSIIFERFRQLRDKNDPDMATQGIGLGLAICKEIVTQHEGKIWVEDNEEGGSRFSFTIPLRVFEEKEKAA